MHLGIACGAGSRDGAAVDAPGEFDRRGVHIVAPREILAEQILAVIGLRRSEEHTSELQSLMRISYAVFCLKKKKKNHIILLANSTLTHNSYIPGILYSISSYSYI